MYLFALLLVVTGVTSSEITLEKSENELANVSALPVTLSNVTGEGRALLDNLRGVALPFVVQKLGLIECAGLDHAFGGKVFEQIMGPGADFGGNYLCQPTCGGECVPTRGLGEAPISIYYPFGCRCSPNRCDAHGPIVTDLIRPIFRVICARDDRCTCASMQEYGPQVGYLCNWINLNTRLPLTVDGEPLFPGYPPSRSPIRWCSCCPAAQYNYGGGFGGGGY